MLWKDKNNSDWKEESGRQKETESYCVRERDEEWGREKERGMI